MHESDEGLEGRSTPNRPPTVKVGQYPIPLLLTGASIDWSPDLKLTSVRDDRIVKLEDLFLTWEFLPSANQDIRNVSFDDSHILNTSAAFRKQGQYQLRLTASDGILSVSDDGLPDPPGILDLTWSDASEGAPGTPTFANTKADFTTASFTDKGTYTLKHTASDSAATSVDEITIIVNKAPVVEAGSGDIVKYNEPTPLNGSITDDGFGNESQRVPITFLWETESGPA